MKTVNLPIINPDHTVIIEGVSNGYVVSHFQQYEDTEEYFRRSIVYEVEDNVQDGPDWKAIRNMLYELLDMLELYGSKHFKAGLEIKVVENG